MNKKFIILLTVFIDVLGMGIILPILPFYVESFGASAFVVTLLFATYSFFSFFSAPLLGAWSDKIGRRPVLIISIFSTALGWLVFAAAGNLFFLFLGRIIDGAAAGNFPIAQSYLLDIAKDDKERTSNLGLIGAVFGVGLIIGPALGGLLSAWALDFPFWFVGGLASINFVLALMNIPETNQNRRLDKKIEINPFKPLLGALNNKSLRLGFIAWFLFSVAIASQQSIMALYLNAEFDFNSLMVGLVMTAMGLILIINQGFALKKIWLRYFKERFLIVWLTLLLAVGFFLMGITYFLIFSFGLAFVAIAQSVLRAVITSEMTRRGAGDDRGMILGVLNSVMSLGLISGPIMAGYLFGLKTNLPFLAAGIFGLAAYLILIIDCRRNKGEGAGLSEDDLRLVEQKLELS